MMELSPNYDQVPARRSNLRRNLWTPLLLVSSVALGGCFDGGPQSVAHNLDTPHAQGNKQEIAAKFGSGKNSFTLKIEPAVDQGPGPHELVLGVNMDCSAPDASYTSVNVAGVIHGFTTYTCNMPQFDTIDIPPNDALNHADTLNIKVVTSSPNLRWVVSAATINSKMEG